MKITKTILHLILAGSSIVVGASSGAIYKRLIMPAKQEIVGFNPEACQIDGDLLIKNVEKTNKSDYLKKFSPVELANYSTEKFRRNKFAVSYGRGLADTIVEQKIVSCQILNDGVFFEESLSKSSYVGVGKRYFEYGFGGEVDIYNETSNKAVIIGDGSGYSTYQTTPVHYTGDQYKADYGRYVSDLYNYLIHDVTVLDSNISKIDGGYTIYLDLNPKTAVYNYRYQMQKVSNLDALPVFDYVHLTYTLDDDFVLKRTYVDEAYKATMLGMSPKINNKINTDYFTDFKMDIPDLNTNIDYELLKEKCW